MQKKAPVTKISLPCARLSQLPKSALDLSHLTPNCKTKSHVYNADLWHMGRMHLQHFQSMNHGKCITQTIHEFFVVYSILLTTLIFVSVATDVYRFDERTKRATEICNVLYNEQNMKQNDLHFPMQFALFACIRTFPKQDFS